MQNKAHVKCYFKILPWTKITSRWIKDLNVKPERLKLLQESIGVAYKTQEQKTTFWMELPFVQELRPTINKYAIAYL